MHKKVLNVSQVFHILCDAVNVISEIDSILHNIVDLSKFLSIHHHFNGKAFHISALSSKDDDDHEDCYTDDAVCDTIVVTGDMTDEDMVQSYFEGRRSGGN